MNDLTDFCQQENVQGAMTLKLRVSSKYHKQYILTVSYTIILSINRTDLK